MAKLNKGDIRLLTDAIMKSIWDWGVMDERVKEDARKEWAKFVASKECKGLLKILEDNEEIESIVIDTIKVFGMQKNYGYRTFNLTRKVADCSYAFEDLYKWNNKDKYPTYDQLKREVELDLTIKAIGGGEIEKILAEVSDNFKKKYNL